MADLHEFQLRLAHGWARQESERFHAPKMVHAYTPKKTTMPIFKPAEDLESEPVIPDPGIFHPLTQSHASPTALPSVSECAAHLELLEAIYHLRTDVVSTKRLDGPLGMPPASTKLWRKKVVRGRWYHVQMPILDKNYDERSKEKWVLFLRLTVHRFKIWAEKSDAVMKETGAADPVIPYLPPLDVLAVWHSFLLNPGDYMRYCKRRELEYLPLAPFPWERIHDSIRSKAVKVDFELPSADAAWFTEATQQPVDLFNKIWGAAEKPGDSVSEALLDFTDQERKPDSSADAILSQMSETDKDYGFVHLLSVAKVSAEESIEAMVDNVIRQGAFVDKMHSHLWLRSPAIEGTLQRAIDRYDKLTQLFRDYPRRTFVPTLDMDLAWHTHQLSHAQYRNGIKAITGRFIDHDDKIGKGTLDTQESETRRLFQGVFDEEYARCMCWDCEAIFSAVEEDDGMSADAEYLESLASKVRGDVQYYRAAEVNRRKPWPKMNKRTAPLPTPERLHHEPYVAPGKRVWVPMQF